MLIFHPNNITYDNSIAKTWGQYRKRNKRNLKVKKFREIIGMSEKGNYILGGSTVKFNGETWIGIFAGFDIFTKS